MPLSWHDFTNPQLSAGVQTLVCSAYGVLLLCLLADALRHGRRFFLSERWGGYGKSCPSVDLVQNPVVYPLAMAVWLMAAAALVAGVATTFAAGVCLVAARYYFVQMRWNGVLRGMGAPGFMTYWMAAAVFLLELTSNYAMDLRPTALLVLQVDYALIMLSAGIYKFTAGYPQNHGMELGMVNPQWGYWYRQIARMPPGHPFFRTINQLAWSVEVVAAVLMLLPSTRFWGAAMIVVSFVFIATQIRLGVLCYIVMLGGVLFFAPDTLGGRLGEFVPAGIVAAPIGGHLPAALHGLLTGCLWSYLALLPLAHAGLFYNFYGRKSLPALLQRALEAYTNFFGIIIWRVFSPDHTNFCVMVYRESPDRGTRELLSHYDRWGHRFRHVGESIVLTTLFTTLKYYPSNSALFQERLLRYARTLNCPEGSRLVFEYLAVRKTAQCFELVPVAEFQVEPSAGTVHEKTLSKEACLRQPHAASPLLEGARPGSYVPLKA